MDIIPRPEIINAFKSLSPGELEDLIHKSGQYLHELKLHHRGQEDSKNQVETLDPLPFVIRAGDVRFLRQAAEQWGKVLTASYHDIWSASPGGTKGGLKADLLWGTLGLDPSWMGILPDQVEPISLFGMDLVRSSTGLWRLRGLRTAVPWGLALALESRIVHSRFFGSRVPHDNLIRLAPFFQNLKDLWVRQSLTHKDEPNIMVLTAGPQDPRYFEPVYLSRYFGYPLVESRDLTVRSGKVFLKTLGSLQPVDVLIRMVGDQNLDPLTGNPGAQGGVPGLMQAVRDKTVVLTNGPGTGILEDPRLMAQYPMLSRNLLGEELLLPLAEFQEELATEDFFGKGAWIPQPVGIQVFVAKSGDHWELMPGGMVHGLLGKDQVPDTRISKDLWFLADEAVPHVSLLPPLEVPANMGRARDLPSRVADDLFWLGRYTERAWVDLRFMEKWWELHYQTGPENRDESAALINDLVRVLSILPKDHDRKKALWAQTRLAKTLGEIHRVSGQVLDRLSLETHRILRDFGRFLPGVEDSKLQEHLGDINLRLAAFSGLTMESMTRSPGWRFLDMGRRLERGILVLEGLRAFFDEKTGDGELHLLLDIFDSSLTYRNRYRLSPQRAPVLDLLLLDEHNPRSLAYQINSLSQHVEALPPTESRTKQSPEERIMLELSTKIRLTETQDLAPGLLEPLLEALATGLDRFAESLYHSYLAKIDPMDALQSRARNEHP